jgi:protocatechuate 3,4-dioxygenase beta subunit
VCTRTDANDEGPFYLANAPFRTVLADKADGEWLIVTGRVINTKCEAVPGAIVDVWHSDGAPDGQSDYDNDPRGKFRWRGKIKADGDGYYMLRDHQARPLQQRRQPAPEPHPLQDQRHRLRHPHHPVPAQGRPPSTASPSTRWTSRS